MAKKQEVEAQEKVAAPTVEELQARLDELQEKNESLAQDALKQVCDAMGIDPDAVKAQAKEKEKSQEMVEYDIGNIDVYINGAPVPSKGIKSRQEAEQIMALAGAKKMRLLKEKIQHEYQIQQLAGGGFGSRLVKTEQIL